MNTLIKASVVAAIAFGGPIAVASAASANTCPAGQTVYLVNGAHDEWVCIPTPLNGKDGADGAKGATGATGPAGAKGDTGAAGKDGKDGVNGVGTPGVAGPVGPVGPAGSVGPKGEPGAPGATGPAGAQGPAGAAGSVGPVGPTGAPGLPGAPGTPGTPGKDGTVITSEMATAADCPALGLVIHIGTGEDATKTIICNGVNGTNGTNGKDGAPGKDGTNGTNGKNGAAGKAGQTTIVTKDANGNVISSQTVAGLPSTGGNGNADWAIGGIALLAIIGGGTAVYVTSRRKSA